jgi:CRP-like cAMP-binding protein
MQTLRAIGVERSYQPGERLISIGSPSREVFYMLSGLVKIVVISSGGTESVLGMRNSGEFIGEMSSLNNARRSADVTAIETTRVIMVTSQRFIDFLHQEPAASLALLRMQSRRLNEMLLRSMLGSRSVRARAAQRLVDLSDGQPTVELTQTDLAQYIDASREWTSKALGELRRLGAISTARGQVTVLDRDALLSACIDDE